MNIDTETGIRYGVISRNHIDPASLDGIYDRGEDITYMDIVTRTHDDIRFALKGIDGFDQLSDDRLEVIVEGVWAEAEERLMRNYDGSDANYAYKDASGVNLTLWSGGDIFITKSPFYTLRGLCSPCAPNAGHLMTPGQFKTYCLGPDWFDDEFAPLPYDVYDVKTGHPVYLSDETRVQMAEDEAVRDGTLNNDEDYRQAALDDASNG